MRSRRSAASLPRPVAQFAHMRPSDRDSAILEALSDHGFVRTEDVAERLGVSRMTTIRDFSRLQAHGLARRTFGGLVLPGGPFDEPSRTRPDATPGRARPGGGAVCPAGRPRPARRVPRRHTRRRRAHRTRHHRHRAHQRTRRHGCAGRRRKLDDRAARRVGHVAGRSLHRRSSGLRVHALHRRPRVHRRLCARRRHDHVPRRACRRDREAILGASESTYLLQDDTPSQHCTHAVGSASRLDGTISSV